MRRSFDGARGILEVAAFWLDAFALRPVALRDTRASDDRADPDQRFWTPTAPAARASRSTSTTRLPRRARRFVQGRGRELRHSVGARLWGRPGPWDYDLEAVHQFGRFADGAIRAWTAASDLGLTLRGLPWAPRLGLKLDYASGDRDPRDRALGTFNPLFPRSAYFSQGAFNAPANVYDVRPSLGPQPAPGLRMSLAYDALWRASTGDGFYAPPLVAAARPAAWRGRRRALPRAPSGGAGHLAGLAARRPERRLRAVPAGAFLRGAGARGADFVAVWLAYTF